MTKDTFLPGEHVFVTVTLKNISRVPIACIYPMHFALELRIHNDHGQEVPSLWPEPSYVSFTFRGGDLPADQEHVEVIVLTEFHGYRDSTALGIPDPMSFGGLVPGQYEVRAAYHVPSVPGRKGYAPHAAPITFEVQVPSQDYASQVWMILAQSFNENTPEYREALSRLAVADLEDPFMASLFLGSSLFHGAWRSGTFLWVVQEHPETDLAGYLMKFLLTTHWYYDEPVWSPDYLKTLQEEHPHAIATRCAESLTRYWECLSRDEPSWLRRNKREAGRVREDSR